MHNELEVLKAKIAKANEQVIRAKTIQESTVKEWVEKYGISTCAEAQALLESTTKKLEELKASYEKNLSDANAILDTLGL